MRARQTAINGHEPEFYVKKANTRLYTHKDMRYCSLLYLTNCTGADTSTRQCQIALDVFLSVIWTNTMRERPPFKPQMTTAARVCH